MCGMSVSLFLFGYSFNFLSSIPVAFETVWMLAALAQANHCQDLHSFAAGEHL